MRFTSFLMVSMHQLKASGILVCHEPRAWASPCEPSPRPHLPPCPCSGPLVWRCPRCVLPFAQPWPYADAFLCSLASLHSLIQTWATLIGPHERWAPFLTVRRLIAVFPHVLAEGWRRRDAGVDRVVKLDLPPPPHLVVGMPPLLEDADLASRHEHGRAKICIVRPDIFSHDGASVLPQTT